MSSELTNGGDKQHVDIEQHQTGERQYPVSRLMTRFLSSKVPEVPLESERKPYPLYHTNILSNLFFFWLTPLLNIGYKRTLRQEDLWYLDEHTSITSVYKRFDTNLQKIIQKHQLKNPDKANELPRFTIVLAILKTFKYEYIISIISRIIGNVFAAFTPLLTRYLIRFIEEKALIPGTGIGKGVGYSIGLTLMLAMSAILMNQSFQYAKLVGGHSRTLITKALLEKSLVANAETRHNFPSGKIISFMSSDLSRIDLAFGFFPIAVAFAAPVIIGIVVLIVNIGVAALAGIAIFIVTLFVISLPAKSMFTLRIAANKHTDERVSLMRELLQSMKMVKFYSWEDAYEELITIVRNREISYV